MSTGSLFAAIVLGTTVTLSVTLFGYLWLSEGPIFSTDYTVVGRDDSDDDE